MRLAFKLAAALILGIALVMVVNTLVRVRREEDLFEQDQERDQRVMGWILRNAIEAVWQTDGEARARAVLAATEVGDLVLRWRWLDDVQADASLRDVAAPLVAGHEVVRVRHGADGDRRYTWVPMAPEHRRPAVLELSEIASPPPAFIRASILENVLATTSIVSVCSLIALTLGFWLVGRPMRLLIAKARRVGAGDFTGPLALSQRDEIGALAAEIDLTSARLAEAQRRVAAETEARIRAREQLRHADRLKTIGQLASGVAHELGTPLNVVSGHASMIVADPVPARSIAGARVILQQTERMTRIIRKLLDFSRRGGSHLARHELGRIVADAAEILAPFARARRVAVAVVTPAPVVAEVDPDQLVQVLTNLMVNGVQAMAQGGRLTVTLDRRRARPPSGHDRDGGGEGEWRASPSPTRERAWIARRWHTSSSRSSRPKASARARGSASRSRGASSRNTAAGSRCRASRGAAASSPSSCGTAHHERPGARARRRSGHVRAARDRAHARAL